MSIAYLEFMNGNVFSTIAEVKQTNEVQSFIVTGTISSFMPDMNWYYNACPFCDKKVKTIFVLSDPIDGSDNLQQTKVFECPTKVCNTINFSAVPRFKIHLRFEDPTGFVSLTLFDREARLMFNKTANELLESIADDNLGIIPFEIRQLLGKKYAFRIDVTNFNITYHHMCFPITKYSDDASIISELETNFEPNQVLIHNDVDEVNDEPNEGPA